MDAFADADFPNNHGLGYLWGLVWVLCASSFSFFVFCLNRAKNPATRHVKLPVADAANKNSSSPSTLRDQILHSDLQFCMLSRADLFRFKLLKVGCDCRLLLRAQDIIRDSEKHLLLLAEVLLHEPGIIPGRASPSLASGFSIRPVCLRRFAHLPDQGSSPIVLHQHHAERATPGANASLLEQRKEDLLLFIVVTLLNKQPKEMHHAGQHLNRNRLPTLKLDRESLREVQRLSDHLMFLS